LILLAAAMSVPATAQSAGPRPAVVKWVPRMEYPREAVLRQQEGRVGYRLTIDDEGKVTNCLITATSGFRSLDEAACRTARKTVFEPALDASGMPTPGSFESTEVYDLR
jgi:periplasmic protein TonB